MHPRAVRAQAMVAHSCEAGASKRVSTGLRAGRMQYSQWLPWQHSLNTITRACELKASWCR